MLLRLSWVVSGILGAHPFRCSLCLLPVSHVVSFLQEKKEFEQKLAKEQGSLREQLQVRGAVVSLPSPKEMLPSLLFSSPLPSLPKIHIQTIGILVSEKNELYTALAHTQQAARQKAGGSPGALYPPASHVGRPWVGFLLGSHFELCHSRRI